MTTTIKRVTDENQLDCKTKGFKYFTLIKKYAVVGSPTPVLTHSNNNSNPNVNPDMDFSTRTPMNANRPRVYTILASIAQAVFTRAKLC